MGEIKLLTTKEFNGVQLDCYRAENENGDFWATREQIGRLLDYAEPRDSIAKIHQRNQERLDKFSGVVKLSTPEGGTQNTTVYNFKGLLEICRFSNQPKANAVIDFLWEIADEVRRTGSYNSTRNISLTEAVDVASKVLEKANMPQKQIAWELSKIYHSYTGVSLLGKPEQTDKRYLTPSEMAPELERSPYCVNLSLIRAGLQRRIAPGKYNLTAKGRQYAINRSEFTFSWDRNLLPELKKVRV